MSSYWRMATKVCHGNVVCQTEYDYERQLDIGRRKHPGLGTV
jgi:hypothetical protein